MRLLVAVMGTTASGKTDLAEALAVHFHARLINADNFQCYRYLDIGTAKPEDRSLYDLLDILEPTEMFGTGDWVQRAAAVLSRGESEAYVVVGGSGLNIRALFEGYDEMRGPPTEGLREKLNKRELEDLVAELATRNSGAAEEVDLKNPVRVRRALERLDSPPIADPIDLSGFKKVKVGLDAPSEWVNPRIDRWVDEMLEVGWLDEVSKIREMGFSYGDPGIKAHGYRNLWDVLEGRKTLNSAREEIASMVRQYAKRQRTWMRKEPKLCKISAEDGRRAVHQAIDFVEGG